MTDQEYVKIFKKENKQNIAKMIAMRGGMPPIFTILVKKDDDYSVIVSPIPEEALENDENKQRLINLMPAFFETIEDKGFEIICLSYSSEAWLRQMDKKDADDNDIPENWKDLPKTEVLITSYETPTDVSLEINDIIKDGLVADENGDLIDCIKLEKNKNLGDDEKGELSGGFSNMLRAYLKFKELKTN
jgi:hypothetical protein